MTGTRVLAFGTYDVRSHPRVRVLLEGLRAHGFRVAECNAPLGLSTSERVAILRQPWRLPVLAVRLLAGWLTLVGRSTRVRLRARPDVVLVGYLGHFDVVLARLLFPRATVVLDHLVFAADTARDRGVPGGVRQRLLHALDVLALRCCDVAVVDTAEHGELVPPGLRDRVVVAPVGADGSWFAAGAGPHEPGERCSVVFFGLMTPLQGAPVVAAALRLLDGAVDATVVGAGQDSPAVDAALAGVPGVRRLGWVEPAELPALVAAHDVCLGVFGTGDKTRRVVPNKVYQGAAAGCAVVTGDTGPQRRALGEDAVLVPVGDAAALADALRGLAEDRDLLARLRAGARRRAEQGFTAAAVTSDLARRLSAGRR